MRSHPPTSRLSVIRWTRRTLACSATLLLLLLVTPGIGVADYSWTIENNVNEGYSLTGRYSSIGLDTDGQPLVALYNLTSLEPDDGYLSVNKRTYITTVTPPVWQFLESYVDTQLSPNGAWPSLVTESNGNVHVAYNSETQVRYAARIGGTWSSIGITTPDFSGCGGTFATLAVDGLHHPHIAYYVFCTHELYLADWTGTDWSYDIIPDQPAPGRCALQLDSAGQPCIAYALSDLSAIRYATRTPSGWQFESVPNSTGGFDPSLQLDAGGMPAIAFGQLVTVSGVTMRAPRLARKASGTWSVESAGTTGVWGCQDIQLQFNSAGVPNVVYGALVSTTDTSSVWDLVHSLRTSTGLWTGFSVQRVTVPHSADYGWEPNPSFLVNRVNDEIHLTFSPELWPVPLAFSPDNKIRYAHGVPVTPPPPPPGGGGGCSRCTDGIVAGDTETSGEHVRFLGLGPTGAGTSVVVRLSIPVPQSVACSIYDLAGRRVAVSSGGTLLPAGVQQVSLGGSIPAQGIYFLRLDTDAGEHLATKVVVSN